MKRPSLNKFDANIVRITAMLQTNSDTIRLDFAKALAREVGILAREMQDNLGRVEQKGHQDYVSEVDRNIEAIIRDKVIGAFPGDVMLGEELGGQTGDSLWEWTQLTERRTLFVARAFGVCRFPTCEMVSRSLA